MASFNVSILFKTPPKMDSLLGYFDKTQFSNQKIDDVKPYTEYFYNWGVVSVS